MSDYLTTADRVRRRLGYTDPTLSEQAILEYIADSQAYIYRVTGRSYVPKDGWLYQLAQSVCTDLAAYYAVIRPAGGISEGLDYTVDEITVKKSSQLSSRLKTAEKFRKPAMEGLAALKDDDTSIPYSFTGVYG